MFSHFRGVTRYVAIFHVFASLFQQRVPQHLDQPFLPILNVVLEDQIFFRQIRFIFRDGRGQFADSSSLARHRLHNRRSPVIAARRQRLQGANLALYPLATVFTIGGVQ